MRYYYHPLTNVRSEYTIFSVAKSIKEIEAQLIKRAKAFGKDYDLIRVCTKDKFRCFRLHGVYHFEGDKLKRR